MKCENCGNILNNDAVSCPLCGSSNLRPINNMNNNYSNFNNNNQFSYNNNSNYNNTNYNIDNNEFNNLNNNFDKTKKNISSAITLFIIAVFILIFGIYSSTHQVKKYKSLTEDKFKQIMENNDYKVVDLTKSYANQKYISKYYTATKNNKSIIYIQLNDNDKGNNLYSSIKKNMTNYATNENNIITDIDSNNIKKYVVDNGKKYTVLVKVDKMIIYTLTETKYKNEIDDIFKKLGYKTTDFKGNMLYFIISLLLILILYLICLWRLFIKLGEKGIYSIIPLYNFYILSKKLLGNGLFFIGFIIPIVNVILMIYLNYKLGKMFNKNIIFIIGLIILNPIFLIILSFDNSDYIGMKLLKALLN